MTPREAAIREKAIHRAGQIIAAGLALRDSMTAREAAEAAWTPTGPPVKELERRIRVRRGLPVEPDANAAQGRSAA